jgi:hypothetical protein
MYIFEHRGNHYAKQDRQARGDNTRARHVASKVSQNAIRRQRPS